MILVTIGKDATCNVQRVNVFSTKIRMVLSKRCGRSIERTVVRQFARITRERTNRKRTKVDKVRTCFGGVLVELQARIIICTKERAVNRCLTVATDINRTVSVGQILTNKVAMAYTKHTTVIQSDIQDMTIGLFSGTVGP